MSKIKDGGPAFPSGLKAAKVEMAGGRYEGAHVTQFTAAKGGLTKLEFFAAAALPAILAKLDDSFAVQALSPAVLEGVCFTAYEIGAAMVAAGEPQ